MMQKDKFVYFLFLGSVALGTIIGGPMGDRYGRKKVIIPGLLYMILMETIIIAFIRNFYALLPMTFLFGASGTFRVSLSYLYIMDLTPKRRQAMIGSICHGLVGIGATLTILYTEYIHSYWVPW